MDDCFLVSIPRNGMPALGGMKSLELSVPFAECVRRQFPPCPFDKAVMRRNL